MVNKRISMDLQKEIQTLKPLLRHKRKVANHLGISRSTVTKYWDANSNTGQDLITKSSWVAEIDWDYVSQESEKRGVSIKTLYREFAAIYELPAYANFARYYRLNIKSEVAPSVSLRIERYPGKTIEIDYSGDKMEFIIPSTGEVVGANLFVAAMSYSGFFYAEFTLSQKLADFLGACKNAFEYIGGVPQFLVSDNCLTAVSKAEKHDFYLNKSFSDFCRHYGVIADPARIYRPKDKPHVENAIGVIQKEFFQKYRNWTFTSLHELNVKLGQYLELKMDEKNGKSSRRELLRLEIPLLRSLPAVSFELFNYKICKVHPDCHLRHAKNFYSVPHLYVGKEVEIKFSSKMIYVYFDAQEIAVHQLYSGHGHYSTQNGHYPDKKFLDTNYHIQSCKQKSQQIGAHTEALVNMLFDIPRNHPLRNLAKVQGILGLLQAYSVEALEYASEAAIESNRFDYRYVKSCAKNYRAMTNESLLPVRRQEFICLQGGLWS